MLEIDPKTVREAREHLREREGRRLEEREALRTRVIEAARRAIRRRAAANPSITEAYLIGSITKPGRFGPRSDVDVVVACDDPESETRLWRRLEDDLGWPVDVRPLAGPLATEARERGERVYAREDAPAGAPDPG